MDGARLHDEHGTAARRILREWIAASARQQSTVSRLIDWLDERADDSGDETAYEAAQRLYDVLRALVDDQRRATAALDALDAPADAGGQG